MSDLQYLLRTWDSIRQRYALAKKPTLLYREADLVMRMVRDHFTADVKQVVVDSREAYERICQVFPGSQWQSRIRLYEGDEPIFEHYGLEEGLKGLMSRIVPLPSGGNLVIDHTEALTVIDVNSSKYTGNGTTLQDTIFHVNKEAAIEIARQLRLRDIGGIIIIDFIDMAREEHREAVLSELRRAVATDRTRMTVSNFTGVGVGGDDAKRTRESLAHVLCEPCPICGGRGR